MDEDNERRDNLVEICINSISDRSVWFLAVCLALGNAADAVEILCVGYIMTELVDAITTSDKGKIFVFVFEIVFCFYHVDFSFFLLFSTVRILECRCVYGNALWRSSLRVCLGCCGSKACAYGFTLGQLHLWPRLRLCSFYTLPNHYPSGGWDWHRRFCAGCILSRRRAVPISRTW